MFSAAIEARNRPAVQMAKSTDNLCIKSGRDYTVPSEPFAGEMSVHQRCTMHMDAASRYDVACLQYSTCKVRGNSGLIDRSRYPGGGRDVSQIEIDLSRSVFQTFQQHLLERHRVQSRGVGLSFVAQVSHVDFCSIEAIAPFSRTEDGPSPYTP